MQGMESPIGLVQDGFMQNKETYGINKYLPIINEQNSIPNRNKYPKKMQNTNTANGKKEGLFSFLGFTSWQTLRDTAKGHFLRTK